MRNPGLTAALVGLAGVIAATGAMLLASAGVVVSRAMSWDLLFNLAGAWHLEQGRIAHVDFHDPVGQLYFRLTQLGFWLCGPSILAFVVGDLVAAAVLFTAAAVAGVPRLPPLATMVFILFTTLLVLMPVNVGDEPTDFTFAMSYNAYGWAAISILSIILFVPRRHPCEGAWIDAALGGLLIVAMYYLKISYFAAALAELAVAFVACRHVRRGPWLVAAGLAVAISVAPFNWPYLADLANVMTSPGALATYFEISRLKALVRVNLAELSLYAAIAAASLGLWLTGRATWRLPMAVILMMMVGAILLASNAQTHGIVLAATTLFLLFDQLRIDAAFRRVAPLLLLYPLWLAVTAGASLVAYRLAAADSDGLLIVDRTNLHGLAVPDGDSPIPPGEEIDQDDYVQTILEAADLLRRTRDGGRGVVLLDQVNPMPFVLGQPPRKSARLWLDVDFPWPRPDVMFAGANHVLVPKQPTYTAVTKKALRLYGSYMAGAFPVRTESRGWIMLSRLP